MEPYLPKLMPIILKIFAQLSKSLETAQIETIRDIKFLL